MSPENAFFTKKFMRKATKYYLNVPFILPPVSANNTFKLKKGATLYVICNFRGV